MSPLVVLGAVGTVLSTVVMLPHLAHALRTRRPAGSALAWFIGGTSASVWAVYGVASGDLLVAAPGLVTVPAHFVLTWWCLRHSGPAASPTAGCRDGCRTPEEQREIADLEALYAAKAAHPAGRGHRVGSGH